MKKPTSRVFPSGEKFNTLGQGGTQSKNAIAKKPEIIVQGKGSLIKTVEALQLRAKKKLINQKLMLALIDVARKKHRPQKFIKSFWRTYNCQSRITKTNNRLHGKYCKNRFCAICSGIKKAMEINKYLPVVSQWPCPYMIVLTSKSVPAKWLKGRIGNTIRAFRKLVQRFKKRSERGKAIKIMGLRTLECNFNPKRRTYNVHLHLVVPSREIAQAILSEWLLIWKKNHALRKGQYLRKVMDTQKDLMEVIKYNTKVFTDPTMQKKKKSKGRPHFIYASAMDNIIAAMQGHRLFDRFGFTLPKTERTKGGTSTEISIYEDLEYKPKLADWVELETEEPLTGYQVEPELADILKNNIDSITE